MANGELKNRFNGSLGYSKIFRSYYPRLAWDQHGYYSWTPKSWLFGLKRSPYGQVFYWKDKEGKVKWLAPSAIY